jgi:UrcA family protein
MDYRKPRVPLSLRCAGLALVCLGGIAPVLASGMASERQVIVKYGDLNLNNRADAGKLLARIRAAARKVCGEESQRLDLQHAWQVCYDGSINAAVTTVDSPILTALARGQYPGGDRAPPSKPAMSL